MSSNFPATGSIDLLARVVKVFAYSSCTDVRMVRANEFERSDKWQKAVVYATCERIGASAVVVWQKLSHAVPTNAFYRTAPARQRGAGNLPRS